MKYIEESITINNMSLTTVNYNFNRDLEATVIALHARIENKEKELNVSICSHLNILGTFEGDLQ
jgi:hypothetical protein